MPPHPPHRRDQAPRASRSGLRTAGGVIAAAITAGAMAAVAWAGATSYDVAQLTSPNGCVSALNAACYQATESNSIGDVALGPSASQAYAVAFYDDAVLTFDRNATTGVLTEKAGANGCSNQDGSAGPNPGGCTVQATLDRPTGIVAPADGKTVHAVSFNSDSVVTYTRNTSTGVLSVPAGTNDCITPSGSGATCLVGHAIDGLSDVVASPDGANVYAAANNDSSIAIFARDGSGNLSQNAGAAGCVASSATPPSGGSCSAVTLIGPRALAMSADGNTLYAVGNANGFGGVWAYQRGVAGALQMASQSACVQSSAAAGCVVGRAMRGAAGVAVSPDGKNVYVATAEDDAVGIFDRDVATGGISQAAGTAGCISDTGSSGACTDGRALDGASGVGVSPDGMSVYVKSGVSEALAIFDRDPSTGRLTQRAGTAGCIAGAGSDGCAPGVGLNGFGVQANVAVSPDGAFVYAAESALTAFTRTAMETLDVSVTGRGTVTSSPGAINCGNACSTSIARGTVVTLTATPATGWEFAGWTSDPCSGLGSTCRFPVESGLSLGAIFLEASGPSGGASSGTGKGSPGASGGRRLQARWAVRGRTVTGRISPVAGARRYAIAATGAAEARGTCARTKKGKATIITCTIRLPRPGKYALALTASGPNGAVGTAQARKTIR